MLPCFPPIHGRPHELISGLFRGHKSPISETLVQCGDLFIFACHKLGLSSVRGIGLPWITYHKNNNLHVLSNRLFLVWITLKNIKSISSLIWWWNPGEIPMWNPSRCLWCVFASGDAIYCMNFTTQAPLGGGGCPAYHRKSAENFWRKNPGVKMDVACID
jgi:hypothetical protein